MQKMRMPAQFKILLQPGSSPFGCLLPTHLYRLQKKICKKIFVNQGSNIGCIFDFEREDA